MKKMHGCCAMVAACLVLAGCRNASVNAVENANKSGRMQVMPTHQVQTDPSLMEDVAVVRLNTATNERGFLRAQAMMENFTDDRIRVSYMIEWYDADAMLVSTAGGGWTQITFEPRETRSFAFVAPSAVAKDFCIKMMRLED
jgi:uncharacterized protein YcfL